MAQGLCGGEQTGLQQELARGLPRDSFRVIAEGLLLSPVTVVFDRSLKENHAGHAIVDDFVSRVFPSKCDHHALWISPHCVEIR